MGAASTKAVKTEILKEMGLDAEKLKLIKDDVYGKYINDVKSSMEQTLSSSNTIYDHITQLSASSEEVAAASSEGLDNSNITVGEVAKCKQIFESIYDLAKDLQNY